MEQITSEMGCMLNTNNKKDNRQLTSSKGNNTNNKGGQVHKES